MVTEVVIHQRMSNMHDHTHKMRAGQRKCAGRFIPRYAHAHTMTHADEGNQMLEYYNFVDKSSYNNTGFSYILCSWFHLKACVTLLYCHQLVRKSKNCLMLTHLSDSIGEQKTLHVLMCLLDSTILDTETVFCSPVQFHLEFIPASFPD